MRTAFFRDSLEIPVAAILRENVKKEVHTLDENMFPLEYNAVVSNLAGILNTLRLESLLISKK